MERYVCACVYMYTYTHMHICVCTSHTRHSHTNPPPHKQPSTAGAPDADSATHLDPRALRASAAGQDVQAHAAKRRIEGEVYALRVSLEDQVRLCVCICVCVCVCVMIYDVLFML